MYGSSAAAISSCMVLVMFELHQIHQFADSPPIPGTGINFGALPDFIGCIAVSFTQGNKTIAVVLAFAFRVFMR